MKLTKNQYNKLNKVKSIIENAEETGKLPKCFNDSLTDFYELVRCYNSLGNTGRAITLYTNPATLFKSLNFNVRFYDETKINYIITLDDLKFIGMQKEEILSICNKWTVKQLKEYCTNNNYNMCINSKFKKKDYIDLIVKLNTNKDFIHYNKFIDSFKS